MERDGASRYKANLQGELDSASLYRALADSETSLFTGRSVLSAALRQLLIGLAAAAVTFAAGRLVGASISG